MALIEQQLVQDQQEYVQRILDQTWETVELGDLRIPGKMTDSIKCWGKTFDEKAALIKKVKIRCSGTEYLYLSSNQYVGYYEYSFMLHESKGLNRFRLYDHLERDFEDALSLDGGIAKDNEDYTKPQCETDFVQIGGRTWKTTLCTSQYKKLQRLFDVELILSTVDRPDQATMGQLKMFGVTQGMSKSFVKKFMEEIQ